MATGIVLSLFIIGAFVATSVISRVRTMLEEQKRSMQMLLAGKGWTMTAARNGSYTVTGQTDGVSWTLQLGSIEPKREQSLGTRWSSSDVTYPDVVANIRTKAAFKVLSGKFMQMFAQATKTVMASGQTREINVGGADSFVVVAKPDVDVDVLLTREVQRALGTWSAVKMHPTKAASLAVDVGKPNVRVEVDFRVPPEHFERFIDIGVQVVRALREQDF